MAAKKKERLCGEKMGLGTSLPTIVVFLARV